MIKPKFCRECKWSILETHCDWNLRCVNPIVNAKEPYALSKATIYGSDTRTEREKSFIQFPACGRKGKLWERRLDSDPRL